MNDNKDSFSELKDLNIISKVLKEKIIKLESYIISVLSDINNDFNFKE